MRVQSYNRGADDGARRLSELFEGWWKARNGKEKGRLPGRQRWKVAHQPRKGMDGGDREEGFKEGQTG
jgi:hypothetical protein